MAKLGKYAGSFVLVFGVLFLLAPLVMTVYVAFLPSLLSLIPRGGYTLGWFPAVVSQEGFARAVLISISLSFLATLVSLAIGILATYAVARHDFKGKNVILTLFVSPLTIPAVVSGTSLLFFLNLIRSFDSYTNLLIAHVIIILPYIVRALFISFLTIDRSLEEAASNLGASEFQTLRRILLPLLKPGILAGAIFGFTMSIEDVGVSIFLVEPKTTTLSVLFLTWTRGAHTETMLAALATMMVGVGLIASILADRLVGFDRIIRTLRY